MGQTGCMVLTSAIYMANN